MDIWAAFATFSTCWAVPVSAALVGAVAGGVVAWSKSRSESLRARRERYGHALLDARGSARVAVQRERAKAHHVDALDADGAAPESLDDLPAPLVLRGETRVLWVNSQLAATLERRSSAKRALSGWALHHHESLLAGSIRVHEFDWLDEQLQLGEFLVVAWVAGNASGTDFKRSKEQVGARFGPTFTDVDLPDFGSPQAPRWCGAYE